MSQGNSFGEWDSGLHTLPDQIKRIATAKKKETTPSSVNREDETALFPGSGKRPYETSLSSCTCGDFFRRHLPCKHIYRLAMELGTFDADFEKGVNKNLSLSIQEVAAILENFSDEVQLFILDMLREYLAERPVARYITAEYDSLLNCPLFIFTPSSVSSTLSDYRKTDIVELLSSIGRMPEKKMMKSELIQYCMDDVPEISSILPRKYDIAPADNFKKTTKKTVSYLSRKYEWDNIYVDADSEIVVKVPRGSKPVDELLGNDVHGMDGMYCFPNDEITTLLSFYGHNRCLNGFAV